MRGSLAASEDARCRRASVPTQEIDGKVEKLEDRIRSRDADWWEADLITYLARREDWEAERGEGQL